MRARSPGELREDRAVETLGGRMSVLGALSVTLEVPDLASGIRFYTDAGLEYTSDAESAAFRCPGQDRNSLVLIGGAPAKRPSPHHAASGPLQHHFCGRRSGRDGSKCLVARCGGPGMRHPGGLLGWRGRRAK